MIRKPRQRVVLKIDLAREIAPQAGITVKAAMTTIGLIFERLRKTVGDQQAFMIPGVGTVKGVLRPRKMGTNPKTQERVMLKEKLIVKIKSHYKPRKVLGEV